MTAHSLFAILPSIVVAACSTITAAREVDDRGEVYVTIGVWGTYEAERNYYIDNVRVTIRPAPATLLGARVARSRRAERRQTTLTTKT